MSRTTLGRALLAVSAVAALAAALSSIPVVADAAEATRFVEVWRTYGFATFAVLFGVLAYRPHSSRGLWAAVIGNKVALTVTALVWNGEVDGAGQALAWDGVLTVLLVAALVLTRGWERERVGG